MSDKKLRIGYWMGYGKAQPVRYLLELTKTPYDEVRYVEEDIWFKKDKLNLKLEFPNLPYLIHGDYSLTEFEAIFDYISDLYGKPEWKGNGYDQYKVRMLRSLLDELSGLIYQYQIKSVEEKQPHLCNNILPKFQYLKNFIGDKDYLLGYFTNADLYFLSVLKFYKSYLPLEPYSEFAAIFDPIILRLSNIPEISNYIASDRHPK